MTTSKKFQVIVADPPFSFSDKLQMGAVKRGAQSQYKTMTIKQICDIKVKDIVDNGAILALWVPSSLLKSGLEIMAAWGFRHTQTYVWVKTKKIPLSVLIKELFKGALRRQDKSLSKIKLEGFIESFNLNKVLSFGMGRLFRQTHEMCLIGINDNSIYKHLKNKSQRSVSFASNMKHSQKPNSLQESLELMFPDANKIELFARKQRQGWTCLGNEVCNGEDINDSVERYI